MQAAADADAEGALEEKEDEAEEADRQIDRAADVLDDHQPQHRAGEDETQPPGEALLRCADQFRRLVAHGDAAGDQARRPARVDQHADGEIEQKGDDHQLGRDEVAGEPGVHEGDQGDQEHEAGAGADLALVEDGDVVLLHGLAETEQCVHRHFSRSIAAMPASAMEGATRFPADHREFMGVIPVGRTGRRSLTPAPASARRRRRGRWRGARPVPGAGCRVLRRASTAD